MRILAVLLGLATALFVLAAPIVLRTDLASRFMAEWPSDAQSTALLVWYAVPALAAVGGLLAALAPGFAALLLGAATLAWLGIGFHLSALSDPVFLGPLAGIGLATLLAFFAGELDVHNRRVARRERRLEANGDGDEQESLEREAALNMDPVVVAQQAAPPPPRRSIPLTIDESAVSSRPSAPPPRWQDLDPPLRAPRPSTAVEEPDIAEPTTAFRWAPDDEPELVPPARPAPSPRFFARAEPMTFEPEPRNEAPVPPADDPWPPAVDGDRSASTAIVPDRRYGDLWSEPEDSADDQDTDSDVPAEEPAPRRRRSASPAMAVLAGVVAFLVVAAMLGGGFLAYRAGLMDGLVAAIMPAQTAPAATAANDPAPAPTPEAAPATAAPRLELPAPPAAETPVQVADAGEAVFDDPFDYCASVRTIDYVDSRYRGPPIVEAMTRALTLDGTASQDRVHWRCESGRVLACASYIGPICDMVPSVEEMRAFCVGHPDVETILAPHGIWSCVAGKPKLPEDASWRVDSRGFLPRVWVRVEREATPPA